MIRAGEGDAAWQAVAFNVPVAEFHTARSLERYSQIPKLGVDALGDEFTGREGVGGAEDVWCGASGG